MADDLQSLEDNLKKHIESHGSAPFYQETRFVHKNGSIVWLICNGKVTEWGLHGEAVRMICTLTDISELKKAQAVLIQNDKMAALGRMAGGIAHEINSPLGTIQLSAGTIEELLNKLNIHDEALDKCLERIRGTVGTIAAIVSSLLKFSRDSNLAEVEKHSVHKVIEDALALCKERLRNNGVSLSVDVPSTLNFECKAVEIVQVILNLISNAYHAVEHQEHKEISIEAGLSFDNVYIAVTDNGPGVPEAIRSKIMDPYFTTKPVGKGTGLGLSISKGLVEAHGGRLYFDEKSARTRFCLEVPALHTKPVEKVGAM